MPYSVQKNQKKKSFLTLFTVKNLVYTLFV